MSKRVGGQSKGGNIPGKGVWGCTLGLRRQADKLKLWGPTLGCQAGRRLVEKATLEDGEEVVLGREEEG